MNKKKWMFGWMLLVLFVPKVSALTFEVKTGVDDTSVESGTVSEIRVSLENIQETDDGIASCSLDIQFDSNILLDSKVRSLGSWTMTTGNFYLFDSGEFFKDRSDLFIIPVKINGEGSVKLIDIMCSDGNTETEINDKVINFTINDTEEENNDEDINVDEEVIKDSNCDLSEINLSEGTIEFNSDITEYELKVTNFDDLKVDPVLSSDKASYSIEKNESKQIIITVVAEDTTKKTYTLYVEEVLTGELNKASNNNRKYVPIFIGIICILILINIIRIIVNMKKK